MAYWNFNTEPSKWSWEMQQAKGHIGEEWTGVRNYQARNNMRAMRVGDKGYFYHSHRGREIVGIVEVSTPSQRDSTAEENSGWDCVDIRAICSLAFPVGLKAIKENSKLARMSLVTSTRLSVQPVREEEYLEICQMGGLLKPPLDY